MLPSSFSSFYNYAEKNEVFFFSLVLVALSCFGGEGQKLLRDEVIVLQKIAQKLNMRWDFSVDPCRAQNGWVVPSDFSGRIVNNLTCSCSTSVCHVTSIQLRGQNLTGELPSEFANLTYLNFIDLSRNYLKGSLPATCASLPLSDISLVGNRISGRIPDEFGNMSTLMSLVVGDNQMEGPISATLGRLTNLHRLVLTANNFSGELPESLGNLKKMTDMVIDGNPLSGKIPHLIGNWTLLQRLDMQGTSLEGPFPPNFANLSSITELRISDLKGDGKFPPVQNMKGLKELVLRNLAISGQIPDFIGYMPLRSLDLSFNKLSGAIPRSFDSLQNTIKFMYLTNNMLQGSIPNWILHSKENLDLSYNNFTGTLAPPSCQERNVNFLSSYSSTNSNLISTCLQRNLPCSRKPRTYNLFINRGSGKVTIRDEDYEADTSPLGPAIAKVESYIWASSSTGSFLGNVKTSYIAENSTMLKISDSELYTRARLSPLSLKYYGLCLHKGSYAVNLHFAETVFINDQTFSSVGRRIFDVSIQGQKVLQDFNIAEEANGTGKKIV